MIRVNHRETEINGTHLIEYMPSEFSTDEIASILGEPFRSDPEDKVTREWTLEDTETGVVATIYDWKEYRHYGDDEPVEWHIGGHDSKAVGLVARALSGTEKIMVGEISD